jgi:hypothetical protein
MQERVPDPSARATIVRQVIAGILCLGVGLASVFWSLYLRDSYGLTLPSIVPTAVSYVFWCSIGAVALTAAAATIQFKRALPPVATFWVSLLFGLIGGVFAAVLVALERISADAPWPAAASEAAFFLALFLHLGIVVGVFQSLALAVVEFDAQRHRWTISVEGSIDACRRGFLPLRHRVRAFWSLMTLIGGIAVVGGSLLVEWRRFREPLLSVIVGAFLIAALHRTLRPRITLLSSSLVRSVVGPVSASFRGADRSLVYHLTCSGRTFETDEKVWESIANGGTYRLWFSLADGKVLAFERLNDSGFLQPD